MDPARFATETFGTGPFIMTEHIPGEFTRFKKNPDYWWERHPYLDQVVFFYIPEPKTRAEALKSGAVDVINELIASNVQGLEALAETRVSEATSAAYINLAMDMRASARS